jgi:hypothetical protein
MLSRRKMVASGSAVVLMLLGTLSASGRSSPSAHRPSKCITDTAVHAGLPIFPELRRLGVRVWVDGISWAKIARRRPRHPTSRSDPAYRWPHNLGHLLNVARAEGIEPVLFVNGFPSWSNGGRDSSWVAKNPRDYARFMAAAVGRYPQVRRWMAFGEPTTYRNFQPQGDGGRRAPRLYARMLDAAYAAMHAARRNVVVIGGNVQPAGSNDQYITAPDTFIQNMVLPNGRRPRLDMFGINPYTERPLDLSLRHAPHRVDFDDLDWLARRLDRYWPRRHLPIFVSEFGWNTEHGAYGWLYVVPREKQAADLVTAYRLASTQPRIDTLCWFQLYDSPPDRENGQLVNWTTGLRTWGGTKKPSWAAYGRVPSGPRRG